MEDEEIVCTCNPKEKCKLYDWLYPHEVMKKGLHAYCGKLDHFKTAEVPKLTHAQRIHLDRARKIRKIREEQGKPPAMM